MRDARSLPFANEFFDAIVSHDSYVYFGTDDLYLSNTGWNGCGPVSRVTSWKLTPSQPTTAGTWALPA